MVNGCVQSLGRVTSSPVYNTTTDQVLLTYDDGGPCGNRRKWRSIIAFTCARSQLSVCVILHFHGQSVFLIGRMYLCNSVSKNQPCDKMVRFI